jgi:hypothetical protein
MRTVNMEIGGYFGLENLIHKEYYPDLVALNTGRNALAYLIRAKNIKKLYLPAYLCDTVFKVCIREGCEYEFYDVSKDFRPIFNRELNEGEWLYVVNYFGQITCERAIKEKYGRVVFDNVQAFFRKPVSGVDTIYSCRKFFGVPDGAYLSTDARLSLPRDVSKDRMAHILGRYEENASKYYSDFSENDESFYELEPMMMSKLTCNILGAADYEFVKKKREENFSYLHRQLSDKNRLNITQHEGPYMYPFYIENGMNIKKKLAQQNIFIPTLWPNAVEYGGIAKEYSENILPLPVDQRYSISDMDIILEALKR